MATNEETYDQPLAMTTTNIFEVNYEDAYDSDVDEGPNAAAAFMANLSSTSATNSQVNEVHSNDNQIFDNVDYQLSQEMHQEEHLGLTFAETEIDDNYDPVSSVSTSLGTVPRTGDWLPANEFASLSYICSIVLTSDIVVPPSSNCLCEDLRSACDREHTKVLELEAEVLKQQKMVIESEKLGTFKPLRKPKVNCFRDDLPTVQVHSTPKKSQNWVNPTPLPKKKQVTFQEPLRTSNRPTQKPPVQQNKKPNVPVNLSTRTKPATESRKPMPKSHTRNHRILPSKSVNARRAADHNRKLNVVDHNQFVIRSLKSVNTKTPQAKHSVNHTKKVWKATRNHNVNTTKTAWRPTGKVVGSVKPQWKPTGRHFALYDNCPLTRIMEPIVEPLELTPSVSSSSKVTMISRFPDCKLSDRKAGSKGISGIFEC
ncbi:hypothetical protein Tco_1485294 [Tanacetum coccineum]